MRFREHRGSLAEAMLTMVALRNRAELVAHCQKLLAPFRFKVGPNALRISAYMEYPDHRIGWDKTYIVSIDGYGVIGFTDTNPE